MLLDRRRIKKWAKWVALFLAIVFAGGFLFLGVGYGGAGFNLSDAFSVRESARPWTILRLRRRRSPSTRRRWIEEPERYRRCCGHRDRLPGRTTILTDAAALP